MSARGSRRSRRDRVTRLDLALVAPDVRYRESFVAAIAAFQREGLSWWSGGDIPLAERDFAAFVRKRLADAEEDGSGRIPKTHLWAIVDDVFVGRIAIFHRLEETLRAVGGHIGYDTVPSMRGRGIAREMLRQALPIARALGIARVLLTCDDTNAASIRVIEANGGVLERTFVVEGTKRKRAYWIET